MISIITCTRSTLEGEHLYNNIKSTVGIPFELITINNEENKHDIFNAYNIGKNKAIYPIICFVHDDVKFISQNWGEKIIKHFEEDLDTGLLGIGGTNLIHKIPTIWWASSISGKLDFVCQNLVDTDRNDPSQSCRRCSPNIEGLRKKQVLLLDGIFLCIKKEILQKISFDEITYSGFHFYDMDMSLQIWKAGYKSFCIYDVLLEHRSVSNIDRSWITSARKFYKKWGTYLPINTNELSKDDFINSASNSARVMINLLKMNSISPISFFSPFELMYILKIYFFTKCKKFFRFS